MKAVCSGSGIRLSSPQSELEVLLTTVQNNRHETWDFHVNEDQSYGLVTLKIDGVWPTEKLVSYHITIQCHNPADYDMKEP
jgi:hypothetical protein